MSSIPSPRSWSTKNPDSPFHTAILVCLVALLSYLGAELGGVLVLRPQMVWPIWPGCALLVAVLLLVPRRIRPILIAAGLAGFVLYDLRAGLTLRSIALLVLSDTVEVLIATVGVSYLFDDRPCLNSVKSLARYSLFAAVLAPLSAAFINTVAFGGNYWIRWRIGYFTEALALLTLTPAILGWASIGQAWAQKSRAFYFEGATPDCRFDSSGLRRFRDSWAQRFAGTRLCASAVSAVVRSTFWGGGNEHLDGCSCFPFYLGCSPRTRPLHCVSATHQCDVTTALPFRHCSTLHGSRSSSGGAETDRAGLARKPESVDGRSHRAEAGARCTARE